MITRGGGLKYIYIVIVRASFISNHELIKNKKNIEKKNIKKNDEEVFYFN